MEGEIRATSCHRATHLDQITGMHLMTDACVTDGTTGAVSNYTTALERGECGRGYGGDEMSPRYPARPDHQNAPDEGGHA